MRRLVIFGLCLGSFQRVREEFLLLRQKLIKPFLRSLERRKTFLDCLGPILEQRVAFLFVSFFFLFLLLNFLFRFQRLKSEKEKD